MNPPIMHLLLLVIALGCFLLATWGPTAPNWNRLVSAGLAAFVASMIRW